MPGLSFQKPSESSKLKEHLETWTGRLSLWKERRIGELLYEDQAIQDRLKAPENVTNIAKISKKFKVLMSKGNVNGALKLLTNSMSNGIFPLSNKTLHLVRESLVMRAAMLTKGDSEPSGLDADGWRRIFTSS